jgi:hypothetical protein
VVLKELYAGTAERDRQVVERLERDFDRARRILVPNLSDWAQAGKVLAHLAAKYHYEKTGQGRLSNDALIAMSAGAAGHPSNHSRRTRFQQARRVSHLPVASDLALTHIRRQELFADYSAHKSEVEFPA